MILKHKIDINTIKVRIDVFRHNIQHIQTSQKKFSDGIFGQRFSFCIVAPCKSNSKEITDIKNLFGINIINIQT